MGVEPMKKEELEALLTGFGLELDDVVVEEGVEMYKIDIPANRADLLCVEAIAVNLKCYLGHPHPEYKLLPPTVSIDVDESVRDVRPFMISAVLRNVHFTQESYKSFIDFQDKLHHNLCRRRTLASIGTHDMDKIEYPFTYTAEKPEDIKFVPLMGGPEVDGRTLYKNLQSHQQLSKYLPLLDEHELWPVVRDAKKRVMSLPPIINSELSKIDLNTKNVFIECTAMDYTRAVIAVVALCCAFSIYSDEPYTIEQVNVNQDGKTVVNPEFKYQEFDVDVSYIRTITSLNQISEEEIIALLEKMQLKAKSIGDGKLRVSCPPTRSDVLHACDIAEDVAIAFSYNKIDQMSRRTISSGRPQPMWEYCDRIAKEFANALYDQVLTFSLCSRKECYSMLNLEDDGLACTIKNAKTEDFEIVRTSLLGGLLKVNKKILSQPNLKNILPLRLFEVADVVLRDENTETNCRNEKRLCATICDSKSRFGDLHGLLDRFLILNRGTDKCKLVREDCPTCIAGQRAAIMFNDQKVGWIGVIHPSVLINFDLTKPIVAFEVLVEPFLRK
jgi:phenylalanyl-tRNA synthetase beta chain